MKPIAAAFEKVVGATVDGATAFLSRICLPVAEEYGLLLKDRVAQWRAQNAARTLKAAEAMAPEGEVAAHPRVVHKVLEACSWCESEVLQQMYAGLLASACTHEGPDESNVIFIDILSKLTSTQARVFEYICLARHKVDGSYFGSDRLLSIPEWCAFLGLNDKHQVHAELLHLGYLGIASTGGLDSSHLKSEWKYGIHATRFGLTMFARCKGWAKGTDEFFEEHGGATANVPKY